MCKAFLPLLRKTTSPNDPSRIVNISSVASSLKAYSPTIQALLRSSATSMAWSDLSDITEKYLTSVANGTEESAGFGPLGRAYSFSKATVNALIFILARENPDILINACCPGWVATDMGRQIGRAPKSVEDGAKIPVRLAVGDIGNVTGRYWANESVRGKGEGEVREW
jgi:carbonyl reductase 1